MASSSASLYPSPRMFTRSPFLIVCALSSSSFAYRSQEFANSGRFRAMHAYEVPAFTETGFDLRARQVMQMCPVSCGGDVCCNMGEVCMPGGCSGCLPGEVRCVPGLQGCCPAGMCSMEFRHCDLPCAADSLRCGDSCCNTEFACSQIAGTAICVTSIDLPPASGLSAPVPSPTPQPSTITSSEATATTEHLSTTANVGTPIATTGSQTPATVTDNLAAFSSASNLDLPGSFTLNAAVITALTIFLTGLGRYLV